MLETALFSGKIYTGNKNFTLPPVATIATNSKSESMSQDLTGSLHYNFVIVSLIELSLDCREGLDQKSQ